MSGAVVAAGRPDEAFGETSEGTVAGERHPYITRAYEVIEHPRTALTLESLTGYILAHLIRESYRRLSIKNVAFLGLRLCSAVHHLHRRNILHLDLKPTNIVSGRGFARVLNLSVARRRGATPASVPTITWLRSRRRAADVWGIGAVLFEATTGEVPFDGEDEDRYEQLERPIERSANTGACQPPSWWKAA